MTWRGGAPPPNQKLKRKTPRPQLPLSDTEQNYFTVFYGGRKMTLYPWRKLKGDGEPYNEIAK